MASEKAVDTTIDVNDLLDIELEQEVESETGEGAKPTAPAAKTEDEDEIIVSLGDPAPGSQDEHESESDAEWLKNLRKSHREQSRLNREQARRIQELEQQLKPQPIALGNKPTLESCEFDPQRFETELLAYNDRKLQLDRERDEQQRAQQAQAAAWQNVMQRYETSKTGWKSKAKDYTEAEQEAANILNVVQQGIILQGSQDPSKILYYLGKNPAKANELAKLSNHVDFIFAVAKLEDQLKVTTRKAPAPDTTPRGSATTLAGGAHQTLTRLRAEAEKTGDYSKVMAYRRELKAKGVQFN